MWFLSGLVAYMLVHKHWSQARSVRLSTSVSEGCVRQPRVKGKGAGIAMQGGRVQAQPCRMFCRPRAKEVPGLENCVQR